jgi:RNA polymerase sigma-54 factor
LDFSLSQNQKQLQKLSPAMRQSLDILQMSARDLRDAILRECAKNPTIEVDDFRDKPSGGREKSDAHREFLENIAGEISLEEHILQQVPDWTREQRKILAAILECIDERGFFDGDPKAIAAKVRTTLANVQSLCVELKSLHPYGIGAKNLRECLLLQLQHFEENSTVATAKILLLEHFEELQIGNIDRLSERLHIARGKIMEAGKLIARLNFSPASGFSSERNVHIIADVKIFKRDGEWTVLLNSECIPTVRFTKMYRDTMSGAMEPNAETLQYLRKQAKFGRRLCDAIGKRQETLLAISRVILHRQMEFFENGTKFMAPLRLKDIASETGLHSSTISRAMRGKYVSTPHGTFPMSKFLDVALGGTVSRSTVLEKMREIISTGGEKYSDAEIAEILGRSSIKIARRTVTKYRKILHFPSSRGQGHGKFSDV